MGDETEHGLQMRRRWRSGGSKMRAEDLCESSAKLEKTETRATCQTDMSTISVQKQDDLLEQTCPTDISTVSVQKQDIVLEGEQTTGAFQIEILEVVKKWKADGTGAETQLDVCLGDRVVVEWRQPEEEGGFWLYGFLEGHPEHCGYLPMSSLAQKDSRSQAKKTQDETYCVQSEQTGTTPVDIAIINSSLGAKESPKDATTTMSEPMDRLLELIREKFAASKADGLYLSKLNRLKGSPGFKCVRQLSCNGTCSPDLFSKQGNIRKQFFLERQDEFEVLSDEDENDCRIRLRTNASGSAVPGTPLSHVKAHVAAVATDLQTALSWQPLSTTSHKPDSNSWTAKATLATERLNALSASGPSAEDCAHLLAQYAQNYMRRQQAASRPGALGPRISSEDAERLAKMFEQDISERGFLTPDCVLAEIEHACRVRRWHQGRLLSDPNCGPLLKGLLRMLFQVETTLKVAFATQVVVTLHELELSLMKTAPFKSLGSFREASLGDLHYHPMVSKHLRFHAPDLPPFPMPDKFPDINGSDVVAGLTGFLPDGKALWDLESEDAFTVEKGLSAMARARGLSDFRALGVYIQRDWVVGIVLRSMKCKAGQQARRTREMSAAVDRALGMLGSEASLSCSCNWERWEKTFLALAGLDSISQRLQFAQELTAQSIGALPDGAEFAEGMGNKFVRAVLAPLLLASLIVAQTTRKKSSSGAQLRSLAIGVEMMQKLLHQHGAPEGLALVTKQLEAFPDVEPSLVATLLRAERTLVSISGLQSAAELPISLPELLAADAELGSQLDAAITRGSASKESPSSHDKSDECAVAQHLAELIRASIEDRQRLAAASGQGAEAHGHGSSSPQPLSASMEEILTAVGRAEGALCKVHGIETFTELGFGSHFGAFLSRHSRHLLEAIRPGGLDDKLGQAGSILPFLVHLANEGVVDQREALDRAASHFGCAHAMDIIVKAVEHMAACRHSSEMQAIDNFKSSHRPIELQLYLARSRSHTKMQEFGEQLHASYSKNDIISDENTIAAAISCIGSVPPLLDLHEALHDWSSQFHRSLGTLTEFLRSDGFCNGSCFVVEVRLGLFMRLTDGKHETLLVGLKSYDHRTVAATVLSRLLQDGPHAPVGQFEKTLASHYRRWHDRDCEFESSSCRGLEIFLLEMLAILPREARDLAGSLLVRPFLSLKRQRQWLVDASRKSPELCIAACWMGEKFGVLEWQHLKWVELGYTPFAVLQSIDGDASAQLSAKKPIHESPTELQGDSTDVDSTLKTGMSSAECREREQSTIGELPLQLAEKRTAFSVGNSNEALCLDIARLKAVDLRDVEPLSRSWQGAGPKDDATRSLQQTVQGAVQRLAADLYSTETHFLLELLQNVDDCRFQSGENPKLRLVIEANPSRFDLLTSFQDVHKPTALLALEYNETGFEEQHVRALCDIAQSTKVTEQRIFIGAKGIGFKSVFRVTKTPIVHSCKYHFHFDAAALGGLGYLVPFPLPPPKDFESVVFGTRLVLPLVGSGRLTEVRTYVMQDVQPTLLLFLRKLSIIEIVDLSTSIQREMLKELQGQVVVLHTTSSKKAQPCKGALGVATHEQAQVSQEKHVERWLLHKHKVTTSSKENTPTELQLAFRLYDENIALVAEGIVCPPLQQAFAWLPLRSYGFRFIVQADWVVPSSREAITETDPFNQDVRDSLPVAFADGAAALIAWARSASGCHIAESVEVLLTCLVEDMTAFDSDESGGPQLGVEAAASTGQDEALEKMRQYLWNLYSVVPLPGEAAEFFAPIPARILQELKRVPILVVRYFPCSPAAKSEQEEGAVARSCLAFARPDEAVRAALSSQVPVQWSDQLQSAVEPLLNAAGRYVEVGGLPAALAEHLKVPCIDGLLATECLEQLLPHLLRTGALKSSGSEGAGVGIPQKVIDTILVLLLVIAYDPNPQIARLSRVRMLPTSDGQLASAHGATIYNVGADFQGVVPDTRTLDIRFAASMHKRVAGLLHRLGVERSDGQNFFRQVLVPILTGSSPPTSQALIQCTRVAKNFLEGLDEGSRTPLLALLCDNIWVVAASDLATQELIVLWRSGVTFHLSALPQAFSSVYPRPWLSMHAAYAEEGQKQQWQTFWTWLGAWPSVGIEVINCEAVVTDFESNELGSIMDVLDATPAGHQKFTLSLALVELLADHGDSYVNYLKRPSRMDETDGGWSSFAQLLQNRDWVPTAGGLLLSPRAGWLPRSRVSPLEESYTFHPAVRAMMKGWPNLALREEPDLHMLLSILKDLIKVHNPQHSVAELVSLYSHIAAALPEGGLADTETCEAAKFLKEESWIFVPKHPVLDGGKARDAFDSKGERVSRPGAFWPPTALVFSDPARLFDSYSRSVSDATCDLARKIAPIRVVGQYYWGPETLFPPNMQAAATRFSKDHADVHQLFRQVGVGPSVGWENYIRVVEGVGARAEQSETLSEMEAAAMSRAMQQILLHLREVVDTELCSAAEDGSDMEEESAACDGIAAGGDAAVPLVRLLHEHRVSATLRHFLERALPLRCMPTKAGTWEPLAQVLFLNCYFVSEWRGEALRLVTSLPISSNFEAEHVRTSLKFCGLVESMATTRRARVSHWQKGREAQLASATFLAAVRWSRLALASSLPAVFLESLWLEACSVDFFQALAEPGSGGGLTVEEVVRVPLRVARGSNLADPDAEHDTLVLVQSHVHNPGGSNRESQEDQGCLVCTRPGTSASCFVGLQYDKSSNALVATFVEPAQEAMTMTPLAAALVNCIIDRCVDLVASHAALAPAGSVGISMPERDALKRQLLKLLQAVAAKLQPSDPHEAPVVVANRAAYHAGYDGSGGPADLVGHHGNLASSSLDSAEDIEARAERQQRWEAAAHAGAQSDDEIVVEGPLLMDQVSSTSGHASGMLASASAALSTLSSQKDPTMKSASMRGAFSSGIPLGTLRDKDAPLGTEAPVPRDVGHREAVPENSEDAKSKALRSKTDTTSTSIDGRLRLATSFMPKREEDCDDSCNVLTKEVSLGAAWSAIHARLPQIQEDEVMQLVGRAGEEVTARILEEDGYQVAWVNRIGETGWPFDLLAKPLNSSIPLVPALSHLFSNGGSQSSASSDRKTTEASRKLTASIEKAIAADRSIVLVEVKASLAARHDVFDISAVQLAAARSYGPRFWLARLRNVSNSSAQLHVVRDLHKAISDHRVRLLMIG